ncbi:MAG: alpha/beta hydrolase [Bacteroidota bacterium]|nr:alpha/beta hydrolase [Bacteroidota bacterium]
MNFKKSNIALAIIILFFQKHYIVLGQLPYTDIKYNYNTNKNLSYGMALDYAGKLDTLQYDIYKPTGDGNTHRPLLIVIHGGAWIGGTKNDASIEGICKQMAARGYVVAAINYRLGMHLSPSGGAAATCPVQLDSRIYVADTMEVVRAIYRGMQDVKGAIRFFKSRHLLDSTCTENIYLCGESAGSFLAYNTLLMNAASKKPKHCENIADAPTPHSSLVGYLPKGYSLKRPDLGTIDGSININGYDTKVKGIACFFGGVLDMKLFKNIDTPLIYLFHQTSDVVVDCGRASLLSSMSYNCLDPFGFLGCKHIWNMPLSWGSCALVDSLKKAKYDTAKYTDDIVHNTGPNCVQSPPGHAIDNISLRCNNIAVLFAKEITKVENNSNCHPNIAILQINTRV